MRRGDRSACGYSAFRLNRVFFVEGFCGKLTLLRWAFAAASGTGPHHRARDRTTSQRQQGRTVTTAGRERLRRLIFSKSASSSSLHSEVDFDVCALFRHYRLMIKVCSIRYTIIVQCNLSTFFKSAFVFDMHLCPHNHTHIYANHLTYLTSVHKGKRHVQWTDGTRLKTIRG